MGVFQHHRAASVIQYIIWAWLTGGAASPAVNYSNTINRLPTPSCYHQTAHTFTFSPPLSRRTFLDVSFLTPFSRCFFSHTNFPMLHSRHHIPDASLPTSVHAIFPDADEERVSSLVRWRCGRQPWRRDDDVTIRVAIETIDICRRNHHWPVVLSVGHNIENETHPFLNGDDKYIFEKIYIFLRKKCL